MTDLRKYVVCADSKGKLNWQRNTVERRGEKSHVIELLTEQAGTLIWHTCKGSACLALIYRPGAQTACEDLARAIAFLHEHADELQIDMTDYSLWGGSAGARMAAWLGSYGTEGFGEAAWPRPAAVIANYAGLSEVPGTEPPTYSAVGTSDGIASYRTVERRINTIRANGTDAELEVFDGLPHGFGLGIGTTAEGWVNNAAVFWERNMI